MKRKLIKISAILVCVNMLLTGCGKDTAANNTGGGEASGQTAPVATEQEKSPANSAEGKIIMDKDVDVGTISKFQWDDVFSKEYKDDNDEYNSKATPVEELAYGELDALQPGTCWVSYKGDADTVVFPSRIDGMLVTEIIEISPSVKNVTIPDTVSTMIYETGSKVEQVNYGGTLKRCISSIFWGSPYREANVKDGGFVFGNAFIWYSGDSEEYTVPEGVITIAENAFWGGIAKKVTMPSTLKYIYDLSPNSFPDVEEIKLNSEIEVIGKDLSNLERMPYVEEIQEGVWAFGNVLLRFRIKDIERDIVIPENITFIAKECFDGVVNSVTFESKEDVRFDPRAFRDLYVKKMVFPKNTTNLLIKLTSENIHGMEELELPTNLKYLDGHVFKGCLDLYKGKLPSTLELFYSPLPGDMGSEHVDALMKNGVTIIQESENEYFK